MGTQVLQVFQGLGVSEQTWRSTRTVRPQASFSLEGRAFLSDVEPPPLSSLLFQRARKYIENQDAPEI